MMVVIRLSQNLQKTTLPTKHPPNRGQNLRFRGPDSLRTATPPPLEKENISQFLVKKIAQFRRPENYEANKLSELHNL